jgi:hypothetical protein
MRNIHPKIKISRKRIIPLIPNHPRVQKLTIKKVPTIRSDIIKEGSGRINLKIFPSLKVILSGSRLKKKKLLKSLLLRRPFPSSMFL